MSLFCILPCSMCRAVLPCCLGAVRLRREEFLCAMTLLKHSLGDSEMELVFSCMDSHGYITPEQVRTHNACALTY